MTTQQSLSEEEKNNNPRFMATTSLDAGLFVADYGTGQTKGAYVVLSPCWSITHSFIMHQVLWGYFKMLFQENHHKILRILGWWKQMGCKKKKKSTTPPLPFKIPAT